MKNKLFFKSVYGKILVTLLGIGLVFAIWTIISATTNSTLFPYPGPSFASFANLISDTNTWVSIGGSLLRLLISFSISFVSAMILGLFAGRYEIFYRFLNPLVIVLRTIPTAAIIFVLIVLLKPAFAVYIVVNLLMFPIIYEAVVNGIKSTNKSIIEAARLDGYYYNPKIIFGVVYPSASSSIIMGIVQSIGLGLKVSIMAEVLCGSDNVPGLGRIIYYGYINLDMDIVFGATIIAIIVIGIVDILINILKKKYK